MNQTAHLGEEMCFLLVTSLVRQLFARKHKSCVGRVDLWQRVPCHLGHLSHTQSVWMAHRMSLPPSAQTVYPAAICQTVSVSEHRPAAWVTVLHP